MTSYIPPPEERPGPLRIDSGQQYWVDSLYREKFRVKSVADKKTEFIRQGPTRFPPSAKVQSILVGPATDSLTLQKGIYVITNGADIAWGDDVAILINNKGPMLFIPAGGTRSIIVNKTLGWTPFD